MTRPVCTKKGCSLVARLVVSSEGSADLLGLVVDAQIRQDSLKYITHQNSINKNVDNISRDVRSKLTWHLPKINR